MIDSVLWGVQTRLDSWLNADVPSVGFDDQSSSRAGLTSLDHALALLV